MNPEKVNAHIKANFQDRELPVPDSLKNRVRYIPRLELVDPDTYQISNPSSFFESEHLVITSNSRFGDIIDDYKQKPYSWQELFEGKKIKVIDGLMYSKRKDEVPRRTKNGVLTASNLDLKSAKLDLTAKLIYLREDFQVPKALKPKKGDIILSRASGSLKHLGKCVYIDEDVDAAVGGFLSILRPSNEQLGKYQLTRVNGKWARFKPFYL